MGEDSAAGGRHELDEDVLARAARVRLLLMDVDGAMATAATGRCPMARPGSPRSKAFDWQAASPPVAAPFRHPGGSHRAGSPSPPRSGPARPARLRLPGPHREDPDPRGDRREGGPPSRAGESVRGSVFADVVVMSPGRPRRRDRERQARGEGRGPLGDQPEPRRPRHPARRGGAAAEGPGPLGGDPPPLRGRRGRPRGQVLG